MTIREGTIAADPISSVFSSPDPPSAAPGKRFYCNQIVATCAIIARMKSSVKVARHMRDCGKTFGGWSALAFDFLDGTLNEAAPPSAVFRGWEPMRPASRRFSIRLRYNWTRQR